MDNKPSISFRGLNIRGGQDNTKRYNMFEYLKGHHIDYPTKVADINLLSETHCRRPRQGEKWGEEWSSNEHNSIWSCGTAKQKGVAILINDRLRRNYPDMKISHILKDTCGRYIKCILTINGYKFRIVVVYAPNDPLQRIKFFIDLADIIFNDGIDDAENVFGGDWNCTLDSILDRLNCVSDQNDSGQLHLSHLCNLFDLEDIYRRRNPTTREYTWTGRGKSSRIDFWLTSRSLNGQIDQVSHSFSPFTDHSSIYLVLNTEDYKRGKGVWKMNSSHLLHTQFRNEFAKMWANWKLKKKNYTDITRWWDIGKHHIKTFAQNYALEQSVLNRSKLREIEEKIDQHKKANADFHQLQKEYEDIFSNKAKGAQIRSRTKWWEEGEKSSKYFFGLEKRNAKEKGWHKIYGEKGEVITGIAGIQKRQVEFYKGLYKSQSLANNEADYEYFLGESNEHNTLSPESKAMLDSDVTKDEIIKSLRKMKNHKSPGPDGVIVEFYKLYWDIVGEDLHEVFISGLENEQLAYSQYLATLVLLYKKGPRPDIKNWRPISLLNTDYKLLSKVFAERIKKVLHKIINPEQRGCVPGRYIGENIRLIDDILYHIENESPESIILQLDQEKAFDRVEWSWLFSVLEYFGFGDRFINFLKTLYKDAKVSIMTNGYQSEYFQMSRGIRQGDALSALLYVIQLEPLVDKIRKSPLIEGVTLNLKNLNEIHTEKGCQYVDDSNTFLKNKESIPNYFSIIQRYEKVSGSKVNIDKTVCLAVNESLENLPCSLEPNVGPEKVLGVPLGKNRENTDDFWNDKIKKLETTLNLWKLRGLSFEGKTLIIRSLAVSKIAYAMEMITMKEEHIKKVIQILFNFLWSGKNYKIKREICYLPRAMGGLNMINLRALIQVKRVQWIIRCLKEDKGQIWSRLIENFLRCLDNISDIDFFALKVFDSTDLLKKVEIPDFYKECIRSFQELLRISKIRNENQDEIIWCNDRYTFLGKPFIIKNWAKNGIHMLSDIYKDGSLEEAQIKNKLRRKANFFFEMFRIKRAFPRKCELSLENENLVRGGKDFLLQMEFDIPNEGTKSLKELTSKDLYKIFNLSNVPVIPSQRYWSRKLNRDDIPWDNYFHVNLSNKMMPRNVADFNFKCIHGLNRTGMKLKAMKLGISKCLSCRASDENLEHIIYECNDGRIVWPIIEEILRKTFDNHVSMSKTVVLTGLFDVDISDKLLIMNVVLCITRFHLWKIRNKIRYDFESVPTGKNIRILKWSLLNHISLLKKSHDKSSDVFETLEREIEQVFNQALQDC